MLGETCYIQQYVDRDPGPEARDFTCGSLSYDAHRGTDIALPSLAAREAGVTVVAAATGEVVGIRDEVPDVMRGAPGAPDVAGRECGNGVLIRHPGGWETQYCHMELGSIAVAPGQTVEAGTPLGRIGLSGDTQFPHLHLSVRRDGEDVDPFEPSADAACGATGASLWALDVPYEAGGLIAAGWSDSVPEYEAVKAGTADVPLAADGPIVLWGFLYGSRAGDAIRLTIAHDGAEVFAHEEALDRTQAQAFRAAGKQAPDGGWPAGTYAGTVTLLRDGDEIDRIETTVTID
ncbi:peptidase M23 [Wenxinia marina]|nr:peptidase M23 [Wenxinia marina]